ncbi:MAG: response regulator [Phototrophicaceae bacterium]
MHTKSVVVVDDDPLNRDILTTFLKRFGYQPTDFPSGDALLKNLPLLKADLFLLDARLPGMSGYDLCRHLKANAPTQHIPIMIISGLSDREHLQAVLDCGADGVMERPLNPLLFELWLRTMMRLRQTHV